MAVHRTQLDRESRMLDELLRAPPRSVAASLRLASLRAALDELREDGWSARDQRATLAPAVVRLWRSSVVDENTRVNLRRWLDLRLDVEGRAPRAGALPPDA
jgi:hypothetical protein